MKTLWIPVLVWLLCAYSVCFATEPLAYFEVKTAVKVSPRLGDPDLNLFVVGQNIKLVNLGIFQLLKGRDGVIAKRALGTDPHHIAPSWPIEEPALLGEWFNETEPHNLYIRMAGSESEIQKTVELLYSEMGGTLILGDNVQATFEEEAHQGFMRRKYILETHTFNSYIRTKSGTYRKIKAAINAAPNCLKLLSSK